MLTEIEIHLRQYPLLTSLASGVVSSAIFLFVLYNLKPSIGIARNIAFCEEEKKYRLKIINKSPIHKVYDVSVRLYSRKCTKTLNGENYKIDKIPLKLESLSAIQRMNFRHIFQYFMKKDKRLKTRTDYAAVFSTTVDLRESIKKEEFLRFEVYAKHSLTGFAKIFQSDYEHSGNIVDGTFLSGNTFEIN